ncbi:hypothetical protein [Campylobacter pinnipediorum]|uniref:Uncharacterized protein n=1 Tax=Campylobacter pinnipediorum subsp. pinnipediorum TaxID=1660067 RepID=A0AAX0L9C1_9BACT|nr:hypothetical protein [Campylobacter pinnipediorum]AQW81258.1 hypothetical protein CPIN17260_0961 [Campylobacter pinnipediorum subsp. pinnipediorum]AQW82879.1 hypothetical protein CPIN17261_0869 [Campylobacter pinnipediorum subsp. pinnipediorum]OPA77221.1 hypothetical protein BFG04_03760 [Campylobacter pinnipediorum subsp. pinnipediorum]
MDFKKTKIKVAAENLLQAANSLVNSINMYGDRPKYLTDYKLKAEQLLKDIEDYEARLEASFALEVLQPYMDDSTYDNVGDKLNNSMYRIFRTN